ncbi:MAG: type II toxin-antitoxin system RelE/ParE family toxin [Elusimicrobia bacterium]|nr:type II toxin-antitoxin system RelE/ParE family toxin [Elusimicrobiota bacterium]
MIAALAEFPELGAPMAGPFAGYRAFVVDNYRVIYHLHPGPAIEIAYIRDCRRKPLA